MGSKTYSPKSKKEGAEENLLSEAGAVDVEPNLTPVKLYFDDCNMDRVPHTK